jgi:hypothetical protein
MLAGTCHCQAVRIQIPRRPRSLTNCNCSICRRYGALWAYYKQAEVQVICEPGATQGYIWGRRVLRFVRCRGCGCLTHWERVEPKEGARIGINARNFEPQALGSASIRLLDAASDWEDLEHLRLAAARPE